jgi:hypothetical protein
MITLPQCLALQISNIDFGPVPYLFQTNIDSIILEPSCLGLYY